MYLSLDQKSGAPLYLQLKQQMRLAVATGALRPGDQLPTVRDLAARLRLNPNTVARVYRELQAERLLLSRQGSGTFVADDVPTLASDEASVLAHARLAESIAFARNLGLPDQEIRTMLENALAADKGGTTND